MCFLEFCYKHPKGYFGGGECKDIVKNDIVIRLRSTEIGAAENGGSYCNDIPLNWSCLLPE